MKRSLADTSTRSTAGTTHSFVLYHSYLIMHIYIHTHTDTHAVFIQDIHCSVLDPHFLSALAWVICFIAAQGKILSGVRGLVTKGNVSFTGLCARQRAGNINYGWSVMCL